MTLGANCLSLPAAPRFNLRGTNGNYWKSGLDPQEAALNQIVRIADDPCWGREPAANWGVLHVGIDGGTVTRPVEPVPGDYRLYADVVHADGFPETMVANVTLPAIAGRAGEIPCEALFLGGRSFGLVEYGGPTE